MLGKGSKTRVVPLGEPAGRALERYLSRARHALATGPQREPALFLSKSGRRLSPVRRAQAAAVWLQNAQPAGRRVARTPYDIRLPRTCWRAVPTCARSRSCSATPAYPRPRSTLG